MTFLSKRVRREIPSRMSGARNLIIELSPAGIISIREKGRRRSYTVEVTSLFWRLVKLAVEDEKQSQKKEANDRNRKSEHRVGRPTRGAQGK